MPPAVEMCVVEISSCVVITEQTHINVLKNDTFKRCVDMNVCCISTHNTFCAGATQPVFFLSAYNTSFLRTAEQELAAVQKFNKMSSFDTARLCNTNNNSPIEIEHNSISMNSPNIWNETLFSAVLVAKRMHAFICAAVDPAPHQPNERGKGEALFAAALLSSISSSLFSSASEPVGAPTRRTLSLRGLQNHRQDLYALFIFSSFP